MKKLFLPLLFAALLPTHPAFADNKSVVREFYETAFIKRQPAEAVKRYVGPRYIQHNPFVANGTEPFVSYFTQYYKDNPSAKTEIKRVIAEGDLVVVHAHSRSNPTDRGHAAIDIFRLEPGKIVEHWASVQTVPEASANSNTMF